MKTYEVKFKLVLLEHSDAGEFVEEIIEEIQKYHMFVDKGEALELQEIK
jgi:hypothetical protein